MIFNIYRKNKKKLFMLDEKKKKKFSIIYKGSKKNQTMIMKNKKRQVIYTVYPSTYANKPQIKIFSGEECLLTCNCVSMFVDRELEFDFMGNVRYRLKYIETNEGRKSVYNITDERDKKIIGTISLLRGEENDRSFEVEVNDNYYRDYMVLFPLCLEICYYKNENI
ncbi:MAG: hypothetical protein K2G63_06345 [Oscillospiraceae bacterium]|nr:hypothetical protein [Oscillospiraceae bacterium]